MLCNPETFNNNKTLELVDFPPLFLGDRKVFRAKLKISINRFRLWDEFSAAVLNEAACTGTQSMVREETGAENLPLNCWYIKFTPFDYINYQGKKLFAEGNIPYQMIYL